MEPEEFLEKYWKRILFYFVVGFAFLFAVLFLRPCSIVGAGERGVKIRVGAVQPESLSEGIHWKTPILEDIVIMNVKNQKWEMDAMAYSKDLQTVKTRIAINLHVSPENAYKLWQEVGKDYINTIIGPAIQESVKASTAQFTASELVAERPKVKEEIQKALFDRLATRYLVVDDFSIVNFDFSDVYEKAIEDKQVAQQNAQKAENDLKRIKIEAEQRIAEAKAEAEAIKIQAQAVTQQGGKDYVQLQAIAKWNGELPTQMIPGATVPFINLNGEK